jgi:hypothetical protein
MYCMRHTAGTEQSFGLNATTKEYQAAFGRTPMRVCTRTFVDVDVDVDVV